MPVSLWGFTMRQTSFSCKENYWVNARLSGKNNSFSAISILLCGQALKSIITLFYSVNHLFELSHKNSCLLKGMFEFELYTSRSTYIVQDGNNKSNFRTIQKFITLDVARRSWRRKWSLHLFLFSCRRVQGRFSFSFLVQLLYLTNSRWFTIFFRIMGISQLYHYELKNLPSMTSCPM